MKVDSKKAMLGPVVAMLLALAATLAILLIVKTIMSAPENFVDGTLCRASIIGASKLEEATMNTMKFKPQCKVIERTIPLKDYYPFYGKVSSMDAAKFREVVMRDFAELIARSWWMTAEGERPESLKNQLDQFFLGAPNKCLVLYAVKITPPNSKISGFEGIEKNELDVALGKYKKSEVFNSPVEVDQTVMDYVGTGGYGAAVMIVKRIGNDYRRGTITLNDGKNDIIYGIAVGFDTVSGIEGWLRELLNFDPEHPINPESSYILIAPFDEIKGYCKVQNE